MRYVRCKTCRRFLFQTLLGTNRLIGGSKRYTPRWPVSAFRSECKRANTPDVSFGSSPETADLKQRIPPVCHLQGSEPPVPPFGWSTVGSVRELDDDVFRREFDARVVGVTATVSEVARVPRNRSAFRFVAPERLESGQERAGVEPFSRIAVHTGGTDGTNFSTRDRFPTGALE